MALFKFAVLASGALAFASQQEMTAQFLQQGTKLVGTGATFLSGQGHAVALSYYGSTAIVGADIDSTTGATWIFTRTGSTWSQQGNKVVGLGWVGDPHQGSAVAISADGNTVLVGGPNDGTTDSSGATWVFTRMGGVWSQQGNKLVGSDATGFSDQGYSVSISADGNTAIVGGLYDSSNFGAAWVFIRSGGVWSQQGKKLTGTGAVGSSPAMGCSVAISGDGNTAIIGGMWDNATLGAVWVFTRAGGIWTQQGNKLVGSGAIGNSWQGRSVSLSADGNTAIVGGIGDNNSLGAAWIFTRTAGVWSQQGQKLVGTEAVGSSFQGWSVSLSADGNTAVVGARNDSNSTGAAWVYQRSGGVWTQAGNKLVGSGYVGNIAQEGYAVSLSGDGNTLLVGGPGDSNGTGAAWVFTQIGTFIEPPTLDPPQEFVLQQNYPNPFNPTTRIRYSLPQSIHVSVTVFNMLGQLIATLVDESQDAGYHDVRFDGNNLASGVYFYRLQAGYFVQTRKLLLLR